MKNLKKLSLPLTVIKSLILMFLVSSCELIDKENPSSGKGNETTQYGPAVPMGNGKAQSFITTTRAGVPTAMGVALSEKALENLPAGQGDHHHRTAHAPAPLEYLLQLPPRASVTPFKFITVDWSPDGHEPAGVYDLPHFDFHFYMITNEERLTITPLAEMDPDIPEAKYIPSPYIQLPGRVPNMGVHWVDPTSPELAAGETFTRTFIYGTYKEKVAFLEPMITLDYIKSKPTHINDVPLADAVQISGYYPTKYQVKYNPVRKEYLIMYTDFILKVAE